MSKLQKKITCHSHFKIKNVISNSLSLEFLPVQVHCFILRCRTCIFFRQKRLFFYILVPRFVLLFFSNLFYANLPHTLSFFLSFFFSSSLVTIWFFYNNLEDLFSPTLFMQKIRVRTSNYYSKITTKNEEKTIQF